MKPDTWLGTIFDKTFDETFDELKSSRSSQAAQVESLKSRRHMELQKNS